MQQWVQATSLSPKVHTSLMSFIQLDIAIRRPKCEHSFSTIVNIRRGNGTDISQMISFYCRWVLIYLLACTVYSPGSSNHIPELHHAPSDLLRHVRTRNLSRGSRHPWCPIGPRLNSVAGMSWVGRWPMIHSTWMMSEHLHRVSYGYWPTPAFGQWDYGRWRGQQTHLLIFTETYFSIRWGPSLLFRQKTLLRVSMSLLEKEDLFAACRDIWTSIYNVTLTHRIPVLNRCASACTSHFKLHC